MIPKLIEPAWAIWSALALLPLAAAPIWLALHKRRLIQQVLGGTGRFLLRLRIKLLLVTAAVLAISISLAEPIFTNVSWFYGGEIDIFAVFDTSDSMGAADCEEGLARIEFAARIAEERLLPALKNNRMGIVTFADDPQDHAFLTSDRRFLLWTIRRTVRIGSASGEGSYVSKGLRYALDLLRLDSKPHSQKLVVFFTDGGHEEKDKERLHQVIGEYVTDDTVYVQIVGLGGTTPVPVPISKLSARTRYLLKNEGEKRGQRDLASPPVNNSVMDRIGARALDSNEWLRDPETGEILMTARDDPFLTDLAKQLHGSYLPVTRLEQFELQAVSRQAQAVSKQTQSEQFAIPLSAAIVLLLLAYTSVRRPSWRAP